MLTLADINHDHEMAILWHINYDTRGVHASDVANQC